MEDSILTSTKKNLGLTEDDTSFDLDIITHINTVFVDLLDLGIGPEDGFMIEDKVPTWAQYFVDDALLNRVKTYMYLRVRLLFDPPTTSYAIAALEKQVEKLEWRINMRREQNEWIPPTPVVVVLP